MYFFAIKIGDFGVPYPLPQNYTLYLDYASIFANFFYIVVMICPTMCYNAYLLLYVVSRICWSKTLI